MNAEPQHEVWLRHRNAVAERRIRQYMDELGVDAETLFPVQPKDTRDHRVQVEGVLQQLEVYYPGTRTTELMADIHALYSELDEGWN